VPTNYFHRNGAISGGASLIIAVKNMEMAMEDEISRLRVHHIESLRRLAMAMENLAKDANGLLRQWEAELNPMTEPPARKFEPPITEKRVE
jgi:hypothetical protein